MIGDYTACIWDYLGDLYELHHHKKGMLEMEEILHRIEHLKHCRYGGWGGGVGRCMYVQAGNKGGE